MPNIGVRRSNKRHRVLKSKSYNTITNKNVNILRYRSRSQCCCRSGVWRTPEHSCSPSAFVSSGMRLPFRGLRISTPGVLTNESSHTPQLCSRNSAGWAFRFSAPHLRPSRPRVGEPVAPLIATNSINPLGISRRPRSLRVHGLI